MSRREARGRANRGGPYSSLSATGRPATPVGRPTKGQTGPPGGTWPLPGR